MCIHYFLAECSRLSSWKMYKEEGASGSKGEHTSNYARSLPWPLVFSIMWRWTTDWSLFSNYQPIPWSEMGKFKCGNCEDLWCPCHTPLTSLRDLPGAKSVQRYANGLLVALRLLAPWWLCRIWRSAIGADSVLQAVDPRKQNARTSTAIDRQRWEKMRAFWTLCTSHTPSTSVFMCLCLWIKRKLC